jgi:exo-1,4-beta-D-glucosaminidase
VTLSAPRVTTDFEYTWKGSVTAIVRVNVLNSANISRNVTLYTVIASPDGDHYSGTAGLSLEPGQEITASLLVTIDDPQIWWPAQWGSQPLYTLNVSAAASDGSLSNFAEPRSFGIRHVTSYRNGYNDTALIVNGHPFLVLGAGYSADTFYRFDTDRARKQLQLVLDMCLNTIRLEGKQEQPELYELADEMGVFIMAGWECCDKWEG